MTYSVYLLKDHKGEPAYYGRKPDGALGPDELALAEGLTEARAIEIETNLSRSLVGRRRALQ